MNELLDQQAGRRGGALAFVGPFEGRLERQVTFGELRQLCRSAAEGLRRLGVRRGDVVGLWLPNCIEWAVLEMAASSLGAAVVGLNTRYRTHEIGHFLSLAQPRLVAYAPGFLGIDFAAMLRASQAALPTGAAPPVVLAAGGARDLVAEDLGAGRAEFAALIRSGAAVGPASNAGGRPADVGICFTTSGSTGPPKLAAHPRNAVATHARRVASALDMRPGDALLGVLPLCGAFGYNAVTAMLAAGGCTVLEPTFDPARAASLMGERGITHVLGGDDLIERLVAQCTDPAALRSWRGGAVAQFGGRAASVVADVEARCGARLTGVYGSSECFALMARWPSTRDAEARARSGGEPIDRGIRFRVVDPKTRAVLARGDVGELEFRGSNVLSSYLGNPAATEGAFSPDGWYRSGDLGYEDGRGFIFVCRAREALRSSGFLVDPAEVGAYVSGLRGVERACATGVALRGTDHLIVFAKLESSATVTAGELLAQCRAGLSSYKVPERIFIVDGFPMAADTNGWKVRLDVLRRDAEARLLGDGGDGSRADG